MYSLSLETEIAREFSNLKECKTVKRRVSGNSVHEPSVS